MTPAIVFKDDVFVIETVDIGVQPGEFPLRVDQYHMGTRVGDNVMILHTNFDGDPMPYMILCHIPSGRQILIKFPEDKEYFLSPEEMSDALAGTLPTIGTEELSVVLPRTASEEE
jgi:hypothetical protein